MNTRLFAAVTSAKILKLLIKIYGGGATAAPGLLAEYIDKDSLGKLSRYFSRAVLVTGTNGKTTTSRLLANIFKEAGTPFLHNREGSNLLRGIIGTYIDNIPSREGSNKIPLLEVDEPTLYTVINSVDPQAIIFNNLFRDQLDRYGEVDKIRKIWQNSLINLDSSTTLILNSDDHSISHLSNQTKAKVIYFGIEDGDLSIGKLPHASDFTSCINCNTELTYSEVYLSHLGKYRCVKCGLKRPKPDVFVKKVDFFEEKSFTATFVTPEDVFKLKINLPGIYNVYNCLAAISAALALGLAVSDIKKGLHNAKAVFGRTEQIEVDGKKLYIALVKNPSGFNEILRVLLNNKKEKYVVLAINDLLADGTDVSWLWDVDFETFYTKSQIKRLWVTGIRANDMALRLKYTSQTIKPTIIDNIQEAIETAADEIPTGETLYILPTYTAMLSIKKILADRGISNRFWEE